MYAGFWGVGTLSKNGELVGEDRFVQVMVSQRVRTPASDGYKVVASDAVDSLQGMQVHLILPPIVVTPDGPQAAPIPDNFVLPNGSAQPFIQVMHDDAGIVTVASF